MQSNTTANPERPKGIPSLIFIFIIQNLQNYTRKEKGIDYLFEKEDLMTL